MCENFQELDNSLSNASRNAEFLTQNFQVDENNNNYPGINDSIFKSKHERQVFLPIQFLLECAFLAILDSESSSILSTFLKLKFH